MSRFWTMERRINSFSQNSIPHSDNTMNLSDSNRWTHRRAIALVTMANTEDVKSVSAFGVS